MSPIFPPHQTQQFYPTVPPQRNPTSTPPPHPNPPLVATRRVSPRISSLHPRISSTRQIQRANSRTLRVFELVLPPHSSKTLPKTVQPFKNSPQNSYNP